MFYRIPIIIIGSLETYIYIYITEKKKKIVILAKHLVTEVA